MKKKTIYIDMDNTICDFKSAFEKAIKETPTIAFPHCQYGFFSNLEPITGAIEAVNKLREQFDVYILTRPSVRNPLCYTEKRIWIEKYFGLEFCEKLILCCNKTLLKGDYLIDDTPWKFEGVQILFGSPVFLHWDIVLKYFKKEFSFLGLNYMEVRHLCGIHRVTKYEDKNIIITCDFDPSRLNFEIEQGIITKVNYG
jgi:5'(3')-deoxyribonucleotidase